MEHPGAGVRRGFLTKARRTMIGIGDRIMGLCETVTDFLALVLATAAAACRPGWSLSATLDQFLQLIVKSLPLVLITSTSTGAVMALQFGQGMSRFGGKLYVPAVVAVAVVRALGPVLTSLMIASRVGSGIAAELGGMTVTQQVDAIRALGTDPVRKLVVPRILALLVGAPMLTFLADLTGIAGGLMISARELGISPALYLKKTMDAVSSADLFIGIIKSTFFAVFIGFIGCFNGLRTRAGTVGIGAATTRAVVAGCIFVMLSDVLVTKLTWIMKW